MRAHVFVLPANHRPHTAHAYYIILYHLGSTRGRGALLPAVKGGGMSEMESLGKRGSSSNPNVISLV